MLIITLGDPYSVTSEILAKLLPKLEHKHTTLLIGSYWHFKWQLLQLNKELPNLYLQDSLKSTFEAFDSGKLMFLDVDEHITNKIPTNQLSLLERGNIANKALYTLRDCYKFYSGHDYKVLTAPINKKACHQAGFDFLGQTEYFANLYETHSIMILAGKKLKVGLVTNHLALKNIPNHLDYEQIYSKAILFYDSLKNTFNISSPKIAICAINPHCGDEGLYGDEDQLITEPIVKALNKKYYNTFFGPIAADTAFYSTLKGKFDGVLAMYHDQGLGPLKTVHFEDSTNITGGLPKLRISPAHGPASDIFLRNQACTKSWETVFEFALKNKNNE